MPPATGLLNRRERAQVAAAMVAAMLAAVLLGAGVAKRFYGPAIGVTGAIVSGLSAGLVLAHTLRKARRRRPTEAPSAESSAALRGDLR